MFRLVCLALCATLSSGQHCCAPDQWEGYYNSVIGFMVNQDPRPPDVALYGARLHYDHKNNRTAATTQIYYENSGHSRKVTIIDNYATKKRLFVENNECIITSLQYDMRPPCIPPHTIHMGHYYIGVENAHLDLDSWAIPMEPPNQFHMRTVTEGCLPYQYRKVIADHGNPFASANFVSFNRITAGIQDDKVFDVPTECTPRKHLVIPESIKAVLSMFQE